MGVNTALKLAELHKKYEKLKESYHKIEASVNNSMREIRLKDLSDATKARLSQMRRSNPKKKAKMSPEEQLQARWWYARRRGNEFSKYAKEVLAFEAMEQQFSLDSMHFIREPSYMSYKHDLQRTEEEIRNRWLFARQQGNEYGKVARRSLAVDGRRRQENQSMSIQESYSVWSRLCGNYYSARNRLLYKDSVKEYDKEFYILLLKCAFFEKQHKDLRGFLRGKIFKKLMLKPDDSLLELTAGLKTPTSTGSIERSVKDVGIQVSEANLSKTSVIWAETSSIGANSSEEHLTFEDAKADDFSEPIDKMGDN